jgi:hypothetical protein
VKPNCTVPACVDDVLVSCPTGTRVIGGGFGNIDVPAAVQVRGSFPDDGTSVSGSHHSSWTVEVTNSDSVAHTIFVYAICANAS